MGTKVDKIKRQLANNDTDYQEEPINVLVVLKDGSVYKFGNIKTEAFCDRAGGVYSITSQSYESYIFPMNSINYIKKWMSDQKVDQFNDKDGGLRNDKI